MMSSLKSDLRVRDRVRRDVGLQLRAHCLEIAWRLLGEADEEQSREIFQVHGLEAELAAIEVLAHVLVVNQLAAQVVGPL